MGQGKKDLTSIEDLGEYLHELNDDDPEVDPSDDFATASFSTQEDAPGLESSISFGDSGEVEQEFSSGSDFTDTPAKNAEDSLPGDSFSFSSELDFTSGESSETMEIFKDALEETTIGAFEGSHGSSAQKSTLPEIDPIDAHEPEFFTQPETFSEVKEFAENSSFANSLSEVNPAFSVLVKNVRYLEDVNDILLTLRELSLLSDNEEATRSRLMRGTLLVPRISEYAAVYLAHKLRRFDVDIQVGLSDEIHPPKHGESSDPGIVSKHSLYQNQTHSFNFDDPKLELAQIIVAASPSIEGFHVVKYVGVATEHKLIEGSVVEDETSDDIPVHYHELAQKLKVHALKANSNAVVGLNYQLTPLPAELGHSGHKYRLTCTGNLVWVSKL